MLNDQVSIITPMYNSSEFVRLTIESVIGQIWRDWEMIIIDDCSTDHSKEIVKEFLLDKRIKLLINETNKGVAYSRNIGIKEAKGKYIAFLDSDDTWEVEKLKEQIHFMKNNKYYLTHTSYQKIDAKNNVVSKSIGVSGEVDYNKLLRHNEIGCLTAIYDAEQIGKFYFEKIGHEDFVYWLNILKKGYKSYGIKKKLASYRVRSASISSNKYRAATYTWNIYRNVERMSFVKSLYYFTHYTFYSLIKYLN